MYKIVLSKKKWVAVDILESWNIYHFSLDPITYWNVTE